MSNTKGSILISNANAVGTALVNKLGGTGYKPSEWSDAVNIMGIASADIPTALANITEGSYTGNERGSIKYSNCNAVGAMLNKKFSTNRGFKPVEWESAISKLTPLAEGTVSGSICNIVNGAEDVPLKEWSVNIPANLSGVSSIECIQTRKNLLPDTNYMTNYFSVASNGVVSQITTGAPYAWSYVNSVFKTTLPTGTYTAIEELVTDVTNTSHGVQVFNSSNVRITSVSGGAKTVGFYSSTFTLSEKTEIGIVCKLYDGNAKLYIVSGSASTTYEPYNAKNYTVNLGRTVYGADVDVVNGEGSDGYGYIVFDGSNDENWGGYSAYNGYNIGISDMKSGTRQDGVCNQLTCSKSTAQGQTDAFWLGVGNARFYVIGVYDSMGNTLEAFRAYLAENPLILVYPLATPTTFTFDPITPTPETALGVNNFWSEQGDSSITYRKDPDIPDPPVQLLNMNNNENNNNEGV